MTTVLDDKYGMVYSFKSYDQVASGYIGKIDWWLDTSIIEFSYLILKRNTSSRSNTIRKKA